MNESPVSQVNSQVNGRLSIIKWVLEKFGLPTLLIFVFLAFYAGAIPSPLTDHVEEARRMYNVLEGYLYEGCLNSAKDQDARGRCERIHVIYGISH